MLRYLDIDEEDFKLVHNQISENVKNIRKCKKNQKRKEYNTRRISIKYWTFIIKYDFKD